MGCNNYRLYRKKGNNSFELIYSGTHNRFLDKEYRTGDVCEYAVSATNGNGESKPSNAVTTDLNSWLNFDPVKGEPFRRVISKENPLDNEGNAASFYYPE